jgi:hypothetical protein
LAGKSRLPKESENHHRGNDPIFCPRFSERYSGSSFFEWKWTAGSTFSLALQSVVANPKHEKWM